MATKKLRRMLALFLTASIAVGLITVGSFAAGEDGETVVLESVQLPEKLFVAYGTELEAALSRLPGTLVGTVKEAGEPGEGEEPGEVEPTSDVNVPVTWSCDNYDGWTAGAYTFTATLGEGYTYSETVSVQVTVNAAAGAKIGETPYTTLDDAIAAANEGDTIVLLGNAALTKTLDETMTIDGNGFTMRSENVRYGFSKGRTLTFKNITANFYYTIEIENPTYTSDLGLFYINGETNFNFENATINMDGSGASNRLHAIYYDSCGGTITLNHTQLNITNFPEDAIEWGGKDNSNLNIIDSTYISDYNRSGITGTWNVKVENSDVQVTNSIGNGSNGSHYTIKNSTVEFNDNGSHGLSAGDLIITDNSVVTADSNRYYGAYTSRKFLVDSTSKLYITNNSAGGDFAGLKITSGVTAGRVEAGAEVVITGNKCSGLSNNGVCTFEEGAKLTITNNVNDKGTTSNGGGIYNSGASANLILPADAVIYNNHADTAGDDIYSTGTITFGRVGSEWVLDGAPDCEDDIDGWYQDGADNRWSAHSAPLYAVEFDRFERNGLTTVTGALALKAAHGLAPVDPGDPEAPKWEISKSKTATNLDANYESQVTLALPAAGYERTMDVVLVIDDTHAGSVIFEDAVNSLLDELAGKPTLDIKVGVVAFDAVSRDWLSATSNGEYSGLVSIRDAGALTALKNAVSTQLDYSGEGSMKKVGGTNTEWAVDMASDMLAAGTGQDKYLIMFSDLYGYIYRGDLTIDGTTYSDVPLSKRLDTWNQGSLSMGTKYNTFADAYAYRNDADNQTVDGFFRDSSWNSYWSTYGNPAFVPENTIANEYQVAAHSFSGFEKSLCLTYDLLAEAAGQARIIVVNNSFPNGDAPDAQNMIQQMLDALEDGGYVKTYRYQTDSADEALAGDAASGVFTGIREDLIQLVDAGSQVVDVIGYGSDYDFDFVNDISNLTLTVNGRVLDKTQLADPGFSDPYITSAYGFGFNEDAQEGEAAYDFVLRYYANGQDGESDECFVWDINVAVTKDAPVQLTYSVKLVNPSTVPGNYGQYDANGSLGYTGLYTNKSATLYPVDSNSVHGVPENFAKPTVSYTVASPVTPGPTPTPTTSLTVTKVWADNGDEAEARPDDITVTLLRDGQPYSPYTLNESNGWKHTFSGLSTNYTWSVAEADVPEGYVSEVSGSGAVWTITNTYEMADIDDPNPPLDPGPGIDDGDEGGDIDIDNPDVPLDPGPGDEGGDVDIDDPNVPLDDAPQTGDSAPLLILATLLAISGGAVLTLSMTGKKKEN